MGNKVKIKRVEGVYRGSSISSKECTSDPEVSVTRVTWFDEEINRGLKDPVVDLFQGFCGDVDTIPVLENAA
ncbi:hypothetical protein FQA47_000573 [Oryzias melastigma]|uniref:Uncharacterized protein n=1 Tax=Oryzias melastigma TaxID=30732 RepID=A0A834CIJ6_ORYME|nr:hypothetical protein FQA47_000573 [Oryzias melastigma]